MCQYCNANNNDFVVINPTKEYSGIEMAINRQGMFRVRYYDGYDLCASNFESQDILNIKFCPMCGREFGG